MKIHKVLASAILVSAGLAASSQAQSQLSYSDGDLFIGFRKAGVANDYLIDIGPASQFENKTGSFTLNLGNLVSDLSSTGASGLFGSGWYAQGTLWGIFGGNSTANFGTFADPKNTLYASFATGSSLWTNNNSVNQGGTLAGIAGIGNSYGAQFSTSNNGLGLIESATDPNSYSAYQPGGVNETGNGNISFGVWSPTIENDVTGSIELAQLIANNNGNTAHTNYGAHGANDIGTFSINSSGVVTFTAVPEPVSSGLLLSGLACVLGFSRRRALKA
jgi:hypothetical protein